MTGWNVFLFHLFFSITAGPPCNVPKLGPGLRSSPITFKVKSGGKISLYCLSEFELEGANEIKCLDTGDWSSAFPTCTSMFVSMLWEIKKKWIWVA